MNGIFVKIDRYTPIVYPSEIELVDNFPIGSDWWPGFLQSDEPLI